MYTPLYVKSNYSFLSSLVDIDKLIKNCKEENIKSVALLDDNMIITMHFYKECINNGIKPIIGLDIEYKNSRVLLYAKTFNGYKSLIKLSTIKSERAIAIEDLNNNSEDLICIVMYEYKELFNELKEVYEYIYLGYSNREEEHLALSITSRVVFANKILYLNKKDSKYLKYVLMIRDKKNVMDEVDYEDNNNYLLGNEIEKLSSKTGIDTTNFIADMCNVTFPKNTNFIPEFKHNSDEYLFTLSIEGLKRRLKNEVSDIYKERLVYELDVIKKMGFSNYFLIVYDYVKYAKKSGLLVGPGRGSAGGSLVAYSLGIIDVDPIEYDLLFERFLNPGRITMPDIDIDFPDIYRDDVINYVKEKYGKKNVSGIVAIGTLKAKAVLDDVSKVLKIAPEKVDRLKKYIALFTDKLKEVYDSNLEFKNIIDNDERLSLLYEISLFLEGFPRNITTHASGIIISGVELDEIIPLIRQEDMYVSGYEMGFLEDLGLLKMDFLGNRNLTTIMEILESIKKYENIDINFLDIPLDDKEAIKVFFDIDTNGIFQFESDVMKNLLKRLKPSTFADIIAANALVRPGPSDIEYIKRKHDPSLITYSAECLIPILKATYGVIIYQEQIMQIASIMAGFSLSEADNLRRAMSKKKKDALKNEEDKFISGSIKNGHSYEVAKEVYDLILNFAQYGFNKSHTVAYSMIAYKMAYLKAKYPKYFYLNLLSQIIGHDSKTSLIIKEARKKGVNFYLPSINLSTERYSVASDGIVFPLSNIRNLGASVATAIVSTRETEFKDIYDCLIKLTNKGINKKTIETLIYASCFREFGFNKKTLIENLDNLLTYAFVAKGLDPTSSFKLEPNIEICEEYDNEFLMSKEKELFGFYLSYHPTTKYKSDYKVIDINNIGQYFNKDVDTIIMVDRIKTHIDKSGKKMAFVLGSDEGDSLDYVIFSSTLSSYGEINKGDILLVRGKVERNTSYQIVVNRLKKLN